MLIMQNFLDYATPVVSLLLATWLGFSAERAGFCVVRAVAETLTTGRVYMLAAFAKAALWALLIALTLSWTTPLPSHVPYWSVPYTTWAWVGGWVFGFGAVVAGGCALSTLWRLAGGELAPLSALAGYVLGAWGWLALLGRDAPVEHLAQSPWLHPGPSGRAVIAWLWLAALWEVYRLSVTREPAQRWWALWSTARYRLSSAAAMVGICGGALYAWHGSWTYTMTLNAGVTALMGRAAAPQWLAVALALALSGGMLASVLQRRAFRLRGGTWHGWVGGGVGGTLMGIGGAMIPGGNDEVLLRGIPALSPHAIPAFLAMLAGVAVGLVLYRCWHGAWLRVNCAGDRCR